MTYPYRIASAKESQKIHERFYPKVYTTRMFRAVGAFDSFPFECKMTGNCCRERSRESNHIHSFTEVTSIRQFCTYKNIPMKAAYRMTIYLDGYEGDRTKIERAGQPGTYITDKGFDCQFLTAEGKCGIHPVKPSLCAMSPLGSIIDHQTKTIYVVLNLSITNERCPECTMTDKVHLVKDWVEARLRFTYLDALRAECGFPPLRNDAESSASK